MSVYPNLDPDARIRELENEVAELDQTLRQYEAWVKALGEGLESSAADLPDLLVDD